MLIAWKKVLTPFLMTSALLTFILCLVCSRLINAAKKNKVTVKGPVRMPTKVLRITTRKTPCGEGSKTWDRYELRIHKRIVDLETSAEMVKQIVN